MPLDVYGYTLRKGNLVCYATIDTEIGVAICTDDFYVEFLPFYPDGTLFDHTLLLSKEQVFQITVDSLPTEFIGTYLKWFEENVS